MDAWIIFRRARIILFAFLVFLCLTLATLLAVFFAHEWSQFSEYHKIVVVCLLSLHGFTAILLYLMVVVQFRLCWDVARVVSLLVIHTGSSIVFTIYRPSFPCRGFVTEAFCKDFVFAIFIGCWVFSGMILCFSIALGFMAFLPRPVESSSGSKEAELPFSPASFKAGSFSDEEQPPSFHSFDHLSEFPDEALSPVRTGALGNSDPQKSHRLWQSFQTQRLGNSTDGPMHTKTMITRTDSPVKPFNADVKSGRQQADSLYLNLFSARSPPLSTPASENDNESPSFMLSMPSWPPTVPELMYGARPVTVHPDHPALYTSTTYTGPGAHSFSATLKQSHQPHHIRPNVVHTASPSVYSFHSATASVHSKWAASPSPVLPPLVLTPGIARSTHFFQLQDPPSTYRVRKTSEPVRNLTRQAYTSPITGSSFQRRGSDGQVLDYAQWRRLVLSAAAKP